MTIVKHICYKIYNSDKTKTVIDTFNALFLGRLVVICVTENLLKVIC